MNDDRYKVQALIHSALLVAVTLVLLVLWMSQVITATTFVIGVVIAVIALLPNPRRR